MRVLSHRTPAGIASQPQRVNGREQPGDPLAHRHVAAAYIDEMQRRLAAQGRVYRAGCEPQLHPKPGAPPRMLVPMWPGFSGTPHQWKPAVPAAHAADGDVFLVALPGHAVLHAEADADTDKPTYDRSAVPSLAHPSGYEAFRDGLLPIGAAARAVRQIGFSIGAVLALDSHLHLEQQGRAPELTILVQPFFEPCGVHKLGQVQLPQRQVSTVLLGAHLLLGHRVHRHLDHETPLREPSGLPGASDRYAFHHATDSERLALVQYGRRARRRIGAGWKNRQEIVFILGEQDERVDLAVSRRLAQRIGARSITLEGLTCHNPFEGPPEVQRELMRIVGELLARNPSPQP
jgi:hypothetical protein